ncbi:MAG: rhodanese-like domain-containing protein [Bdellovibrionales bacterium]
MPSQTVEFKTQKSNPDFPEVLDIDPQEVWEKRALLTIIDVRRPDEFTGPMGHIPGAKLIVLDTLPDHMDEIPKDKPVVFVCAAGGRSARACEFAVEEGYLNTFNMKGGMSAWTKQALEVEGKSNY